MQFFLSVKLVRPFSIDFLVKLLQLSPNSSFLNLSFVFIWFLQLLEKEVEWPRSLQRLYIASDVPVLVFFTVFFSNLLTGDCFLFELETYVKVKSTTVVLVVGKLTTPGVFCSNHYEDKLKTAIAIFSNCPDLTENIITRVAILFIVAMGPYVGTLAREVILDRKSRYFVA